MLAGSGAAAEQVAVLCRQDQGGAGRLLDSVSLSGSGSSSHGWQSLAALGLRASVRRARRACVRAGLRACGRSVPVIGSRGNSAFGRRLAGVCGHRTRAESGTLDALAPSGSWETVFSCSRGHKEQTMRHADSQGSKISAGPAGHEHEGWVRSKRALCDMSFARFGSLRSYSGGVLDRCTLIFGSRRSLPDHQPCSTATPRVLRYSSLLCTVPRLSPINHASARRSNPAACI